MWGPCPLLRGRIGSWWVYPGSMAGRGPGAGLPVNGPRVLLAPTEGKALGSDLEVVRKQARQLPYPSSLPPTEPLPTVKTQEGGWHLAGTVPALPPNMVSVIKIITAGIDRGLTMCQALCQEFFTLSWLPPQGGYYIIFIPT